MDAALTTLSDQDVKSLVQDELDWTPDVDAAAIGVAVVDGTVTLTGEVDSSSERIAAKRAAFRVRGVRIVVDELAVHPKAAWPVTETDIAREAERALKWASNVPETVHAEVSGHKVALTGEVRWNFQRQAARQAVQHLRGVHGVENRIVLAARPSAADTGERIRSALVRHAQIDADHTVVRAP